MIPDIDFIFIHTPAGRGSVTQSTAPRGRLPLPAIQIESRVLPPPAHSAPESACNTRRGGGIPAGSVDNDIGPVGSTRRSFAATVHNVVSFINAGGLTAKPSALLVDLTATPRKSAVLNALHRGEKESRPVAGQRWNRHIRVIARCAENHSSGIGIRARV